MRLPWLRRDRDPRHHRALRIAAATAGAVAGASGLAVLGVRLLRRPHPLAGRVALVAGVGREGLGIEVARELGRHGARLTLIGPDAAALDEARADLAARGMEVATVACDLASRGAVDRAVAEVTARVEHVDVLVNDCTTLDAAGVVHTTSALLPQMRAREEGQLVTLTNRLATVGFSEGLEADLRGSGVHVTTVIAGPVDAAGVRDDARRVVHAIQRRERTVALGWRARLGRLAQALSPPLASSLLHPAAAT